jgi:hypothetical protein
MEAIEHKQGTRFAARILTVCALALAAMALAPVSASAVSPALWQKCDADEPVDQQCPLPAGLAADPANGRVYVSDVGNGRVIQFSAWGEFLKAWGWDVVASGPGNEPARNEIQRVSGDATGGDFKLWIPVQPNLDLIQFSGSTTPAIPFDASAATVQAALEGAGPNGLIDPGDVAVSGPSGGPWVIEFTGAFSNKEVVQLQVVESTLSGGAATASVETIQPGAYFEICVPSEGDVCKGGQSSTAPGGFGGPAGIAVDSAGDVYVVDLSNRGVQKFSPAGEFLLMFGGGVNQGGGTPASPGNVCTAAHLANGDVCGPGSEGSAGGEFGDWPALRDFIDMGPADQVYVGDEGRIQRFNTGGVYQDEIALPGETVKALDVDSSGNLYVVLDYPSEGDVEKLSPAGATLSPTFELPFPPAVSVAVDDDGQVFAFGRPCSTCSGSSILVDPVIEFDPAGNVVNSFGKEEFGVNTVLAVNPVTAGGDTALYVGGPLRSESGGFVRAYSPIPDIAIAGPPPSRAPSIVRSAPRTVDVEDAVVRAEINPHYWADASYYVEYGTEDCSSSACTKLHFPGLPLGAGVVDDPSEVEVALEGLEPETTYHFRFVAQSSGGGPNFGPDRTFRTFPLDPAPRTECANQVFRSGPGALLPDCRAYEMVTPLDKNGGNVGGLTTTLCTKCGSELAHHQATPEGDALTYAAGHAFGDAEAGTWSVHYLASRDPERGWFSHGIEAPQGLNGFSFEKHFEAFSEDLSTGWLWHEFDPQPGPDGVPGYQNLYRRDNLTDTYTALTTVKPPSAGPARSGPSAFKAVLGGFSADGSRAVYFANDRIAGGASKATTDKGSPIFQVYEYRDDQPLRLVSRLPGGVASGEQSVVGGGQGFLTGAVSQDGSRIYWTTGPGEDVVRRYRGKIYLRLDGTTTVPVSETVSAKPAEFWVAARDGSAALFTIGATPHISGGNLYRFDLAGESSSLIASGVLGVAGASEDLSRAYFVSTDVLDPEPNSEGEVAEAGKRNLYYYEQGEGITFVAEGEGGGRLYIAILGARISGVSGDGRHLVFVDRKALTGIDSGAPLFQVFRYSAESDELSCVSCSATGAPPRGHIEPEVGEPDVAGFVVGWRDGPFYQQRFLSDDGSRVYFESFDRLLPADTNGKTDVYQWQAPGTGECSAQSAHYFATSEGCIELLSTGKSEEHSDFIEATPDGSTVFIRTAERLVGHDTDELLDIYAVRTGGGFPEPAPAPAGCEGEACRGAAPPAPANLGAGTAVFQGPGNPQAKPPGKRCPKAKRRVRRRGKVRCVPKRHQQRQAANREQGGNR